MGLTAIILAAVTSMTAQAAQPYAPVPYTPPKHELRKHYMILRDDQFEAEQNIARHAPEEEDADPRDGFRQAAYTRRIGAK